MNPPADKQRAQRDAVSILREYGRGGASAIDDIIDHSSDEELEPLVHECFGGDPELSMSMVAWFAHAHGHSDTKQLSDVEVVHFEQPARGIRFPIHRDQMLQAGKFGCDACRDIYGEWWLAKNKPLLDRLKCSVKEEIAIRRSHARGHSIAQGV